MADVMMRATVYLVASINGEARCSLQVRLRVVSSADALRSKFLDWLGGPQVTGGAELPAAHSAELGPAPTKQDTKTGASSTTQIEERAAVGCTRGELR